MGKIRWCLSVFVSFDILSKSSKFPAYADVQKYGAAQVVDD
jgi:hypothetical protein